MLDGPGLDALRVCEELTAQPVAGLVVEDGARRAVQMAVLGEQDERAIEPEVGARERRGADQQLIDRRRVRSRAWLSATRAGPRVVRARSRVILRPPW